MHVCVCLCGVCTYIICVCFCGVCHVRLICIGVGVGSGDASTKDIDTAMRLGCGYPMGPFELMDMTGVDVCAFILRGWAEKYPDEPLFKPTETLEKMVSEGRLGRKTGHGFYKY